MPDVVFRDRVRLDFLPDVVFRVREGGLLPRLREGFFDAERFRVPREVPVCSSSLLVVRPAKAPPKFRWSLYVSLKLLTGHVLL